MSPPYGPKVLMVVPTLGERPGLLRLSLTSIRAQDGVDLDLVLVAPPSPPISEIGREFGGRVVEDPRRGLSAALNVGIEAAGPDSTYFGWLGDDDLLRPGALKTCTQALQARPDAVLAYGWCDYINADGTIFFVSRAGKWADRTIRFGPNLLPQPGSLMRLDLVKRVGGVDETLKYSMDLDLFLKLRQHGPFISVPQTLAAFRWHDDSLTVSQEKKSLDESDQVRRRYLPRLASLSWPIWRWPFRWSLTAVKFVVKRLSTAS